LTSHYVPEPSRSSFDWATDDLVYLDGLAPGLIGRVITTSPRRRQAIFAVIANRVCLRALKATTVAMDADQARVLRRERAGEILTHAFGHLPEGFMGALEKLDAGPLPSASAYEKLRLIFTDPSEKARAQLLTHAKSINERKLAVVEALDARWRLHAVLDRIDLTVAAREFNIAMAFVQSICSKATDEVIVQALARLPADRSLADFITRLMRRADRFPNQPVAATQDLRPLMTGEDFARTGLRLRNCLRDRIEDAVTGRAAFLEFRGQAVLELRPLAGEFGWFLEDVHIAGNAFVPPELRRAAEAACLQAGVHHVDRHAGSGDLFRWRLLQGHVAA
jgi:hypothetical protein